MGRIRDAWQALFGTKESRTAAIITTPGSGGKVPQQRGYDQFAKETYLKNVTAFRCIDEISTSVASVPWAQYRQIDDDKKEIVTDTMLAETLKRPNPDESLLFVMQSATAYLAMCGNTFFERIGPTTGPNKREIKELYALRPDRFELKVNPHTGQKEKWIYSVQGRSREWEVDPITGQADVLHLKSFHPLDDWWGAAPTESAAREIDTSNAASTWNMNLLQNQGRPGMIYTLIGALGEQAFEQMEQYLRSEKAGVHNVGKDMIITGERGTKAEPYGWSPTDMDFSEGDHRLMRKIAMVWRVPPMIIGIPGEATFANFKEANLYFWEKTILYYLNYIKGELNNWLFPKESDMFLDYNLEDVPALAVKRDMLWTRANEADFMSVDEKRAMVGLDKYVPTEDPGSQIYIESSKLPLGMSVEIVDEEVETEEEVVKDMLLQGYTQGEVDMFLGLKYESPEETNDIND